MDRVERAVELFHGKEGYNCAQAVGVAFKKDLEKEKEIAFKYKAFGSGRAPENICGAAWAASQVMDKEKFLLEFEQRIGSIKCCDILSDYKTGCRKCVRIASQILVEELE